MKKALNRVAAALLVAVAIGGVSAAPSQAAPAAHSTHSHTTVSTFDTNWPT